MKKTITILGCFLLLQGTAAEAQSVLSVSVRNVNSEAPQTIQKSFYAKYPKLEVNDWDWEDEKDLFKAEFRYKNREHEAYFTPKGDWVSTWSPLLKEELPHAVYQATNKGKFRNWLITDYIEIDMANRDKVYRVRYEKDHYKQYIYYNPDGSQVKED